MASGGDILRLAGKHVGEKYVNVLVPKNNPKWTGPWDCAEFASWCVFQVGAVLYGCIDDDADPETADAYTGAWKRDAQARGRMISVEQAAATAGAFVLRFPPTPRSMGHIAICDGSGGTDEAHSAARGVTKDRVAGRRWDTGVLVPGIEYGADPEPLPVAPPNRVIYRLTSPPMTGPGIRELQRTLKRLGVNPGPIDGEFGPLTHAAVSAFQQMKRLVADGEVGPRTAKALGITLAAPD